MNSAATHNLRMALLMLLVGSQLSACSLFSGPPKRAFAADMLVRIDNVNTMTRLWTRDGKLRLVLPAGRSASTMLADYARGTCWALFPAQATYQQFPTSSLRSNVPHFFDPALQVEKQLIGHEMIEGVMAKIYKVNIRSPHSRSWQGTLWESEHLAGYPLKWHDADRDIEAHWKNAALVDVPASFFDIPKHYTRQQSSALLTTGKQPTPHSIRTQAYVLSP